MTVSSSCSVSIREQNIILSPLIAKMQLHGDKMDNISAVSCTFYTIKFMCMKLKNWNKDHRVFPTFCAECTY